MPSSTNELLRCTSHGTEVQRPWVFHNDADAEEDDDDDDKLARTGVQLDELPNRELVLRPKRKLSTELFATK